MIKLKNISKSYSGNKVLDNISLSIPKNSITGIIGPNGAGKSTLIRIITGFEFPDSGNIRMFKSKVKNFNERKKYISYMSETMLLYQGYIVSDFLEFFHNASGFKDDDLFDSLSLKKIVQKKIGHLSKGWHQRLKLYISMCNNREIVILDEPFDGFDPLQLREINKLFKAQRLNGRSFVFSIHQLSDAQKICNYFILLDEGKVLTEGSLDKLGDRFLSGSGSLEDIFIKALS